MKRFTSSSKRNPCPICSDVKGKCKESSDDLILCMGYPDQDAGHPDWKWLKSSKDGIWGIFAHRTDKDFDRESWHKKQQERLEAEQNRETLDPIERDREIRKVLSQLTLFDSDRQNLKERRPYLSEENLKNCRSVRQWQQLNIKVNPLLPGVGRYGDRLLNPTDGILVAVPNKATGLYVALRLHDPEAKKKEDGKKYSWLSDSKRGVTPHNHHGELPIAVYHPENWDGNASRVEICEGMEFKAAAAANRLGCPVIGFSGYNFASSPKTLKESLEIIGQQSNSSNKPHLVFNLDAGAIGNPQILSQVERAIVLVEEWGYQVGFRWYNQFSKADGDIDEIDEETLKNAKLLSKKEFFKLEPSYRLKTSKLDEFKNLLKKQVRKVRSKGFSFTPNKNEGQEFNKGERLKAWNEALEAGSDVLDTSFMGLGKSHTVTEIENPDPNGKVLYFTPNHRNPSIKGIEEKFTDLVPRSQYGFYRNDDGKLIEADEETPEEILEIKPNCYRANLFRNLSNLGYNPDQKEDALNPICNSCPAKNFCAFQEGMYRYERGDTLKNKKHLRADLQSSVGAVSSKDIVVVEEAGQTLKPTKDLISDWSKLLLELDRVREVLPDEYYQWLDTLLQQLKPQFKTKEYYGLNHQSILKNIDTKGIDLNPIIEALEKNPLELGEIFKEADSIVGLNQKDKQKYYDSLKLANQYFRKEAYKESMENLEKVPPNALIYLLKALNNEPGILLRINRQELTVTIDNRESFKHLEAAKKIYLDGTLDSERLQKIVGFDRAIATIKEKVDKPLKNLNINAVRTPGLGSNKYSPTAIKRVQQLQGAIFGGYGKMPVLCLKAHKDAFGAQGHWHHDSRGSNDFEGEPNLLGIGVPRPNLGAVLDEYQCLFGIIKGGKPEDDPDFQRYYQQKINDAILQFTPRQRVNRYPDRQFTLHWIIDETTDLDFLKEYGVTVTEVDAVDICPEAGDRFQATLISIAKTISEGCQTETAIAKALDCTRQNISKFLKSHGLSPEKIREKLCQPALYNPIYGRLTTPELIEKVRVFWQAPIEETMKVAISYIRDEGWDWFDKYILEPLAEPIQRKFLGLLWAFLDPDWDDPPPTG